MRSRADRYQRVSAVYQDRTVVAGAQAAKHAGEATQHRLRASETRDAAQLQREASQVMEEAGLTRGVFFDRLRSVAVARAHVAETLLHAQALDEKAVQSEAGEAEARLRAAVAMRKRHKLDRWIHLIKKNERTAALRRADFQTQEDYACR